MLVISQMRRMRPCATSAATAARAMETMLIQTTRRSTGMVVTGTSAAARAGASDGATGRPSCTVEAVSTSCAGTGRFPRGVVVGGIFEEHGRRRIARGAAGDFAQELGELAAARGRHRIDGVDDAVLRRRGSAAENGAGLGRDRQLDPPAVGVRAGAREQAGALELLHDDGDGALMGQRA